MAEESTNEEIKWLEAQLEAKRKEVAAGVGEAKEEREMVQDVIKDVQTLPVSPPILGAAISDDDAKRTAYDIGEKEHAQIIDDLIGIALSKNLLTALKVAKAMNNPHLLDEFHDKLADKYYQKLLEERKLK